MIDISLVGQVQTGDTVTLRCANAAGDWVTISTIA